MTGGNTEIFENEPSAPGKYVMFGNEPGHYEQGEYAGFEVVVAERAQLGCNEAGIGRVIYFVISEVENTNLRGRAHDQELSYR